MTVPFIPSKGGQSAPSSYTPDNPYAQGLNLPAAISKYSPDNPYANSMKQDGDTTDDSHENDSSLTHTIGKFAEYLWDYNKTGAMSYAEKTAQMKRIGAGFEPAIQDIGKSLSGAIGYFQNNSMSQIGQDAKGLLGKIPEAHYGGMASGVFKTFIEKPVETFTGTINDNGTAKPATPEEQGQSLLASAGLVAQIGTFKMLKMGALTDGDMALKALQPVSLGKLALSGSTTQAAKYIASEGLAGAISGGVGAAIGSAGQDHQTEAILGGMLTYAPLSIALGAFGVRGHINELKKVSGVMKLEGTFNSSHDLAALNSMRLNTNDPFSNLVNNVDALSTADRLVLAANKARLEVGDGYITEGVSPKMGKAMEDNLMPSVANKPNEIPSDVAEGMKKNGQPIPKGTYVAPALLNKPKPRPNGVEVKFSSQFDKLAYLAAARKPSSLVTSLVDDAIEQTGLSRDEIESHGKFVKKQQKEAIQTAKLTPRNQAEIDAYDQASIEKGATKIHALPDGGSLQDNTGINWVRTGNNMVDPTSNVSLPINETNTLKRFGRVKNDAGLYQPYQQLPNQEFNPNYSRVDVNASRTATKFHYADNGSLLTTRVNYTPEALGFFKSSGFLKGEIVNVAGEQGVVNGFEGGKLQVKDLKNGKVTGIDPADARRGNYSLTPRVTKQGVEAPVLTSETLAKNLYAKFYKGFQDAPEDQQFSGYLQKFLSDNGVSSDSHTSIGNMFMRQLSDDLAKKNLSPEELDARGSMLGKMEEHGINQEESHASYLSNQAWSNNLFMTPEGGGQYRLRFRDTGKLYKMVGSPDEAMAAINEIRQSSGLDKAGGWSGANPDNIANLGGIAGQMTPPNYGKFEQAIDLGRMGGILSRITAIQNSFKAADNLANMEGVKDTQFFPHFLKMQQALIGRRNFASTDPAMQGLIADGQAALNLGRDLTSKRRMVIADYIEAMSINDIETKYAGRPATITEKQLGQEISKSGDVRGVQDILLKAKNISPNSTLGSPEFMNVLDAIMQDKTNGIDPKVGNSAKVFAGLIPKLGKDIASGEVIMKLAQAYENPTGALDRVNFAAKNAMSPAEIKYANAIDDWFKQVAPIAGIDPKAQFQMYLPSILNKVAGGSSKELGMMPEEFARELSRTGITPRNELIRDPNILVSKYFTAVLNHKTGFNESVNEFQNNLKTEYEKIAQSKSEALQKVLPSFQAKMGDYVNEVRGAPDTHESLLKSVRQMGAALGIKTPDVNSVISLMSLGSIAGRPALAVRDYHNILGNAYTSFGHEFSQHFVADAINPEYLDALKEKNILGVKTVKSQIDPGIDESLLLPNEGWVKRWADKGYKIGGQEFTYEHTNAAIYAASMKMAEKYFGQLAKGEITKDEAFDKLGITANHGPGIIQQIDNLLERDAGAAADFYGQANMRFLSHIYGFHNNPAGWNSSFGRLLGQWGSWNTNATSTMFDQYTRGTKSQIAGKMLRGGIYNAATVSVGAGLGFNLAGWTVGNPLVTLPTAGPIVNMMTDIQNQYKMGHPISKTLENDMLTFIPYGRFAEGWVKGLDMIGQGQTIAGLGKGMGMPVPPVRR